MTRDDRWAELFACLSPAPVWGNGDYVVMFTATDDSPNKPLAVGDDHVAAHGKYVA